MHTPVSKRALRELESLRLRNGTERNRIARWGRWFGVEAKLAGWIIEMVSQESSRSSSKAEDLSVRNSVVDSSTVLPGEPVPLMRSGGESDAGPELASLDSKPDLLVGTWIDTVDVVVTGRSQKVGLL